MYKTYVIQFVLLAHATIYMYTNQTLLSDSGESSGRGRGSFSSRGGPAQQRGRGNRRGRGGFQGDYTNESNWTEDNCYEQNFSNQRGGGSRGNYGQFTPRGRGRGNAHRGTNRGGRAGYTPSYQRNSDNWNTGDSQNGYSDGYGSVRGGRRPRGGGRGNWGGGDRGRGRGGRGSNRGGYSQNWEEDTTYEQQNLSGNVRGGRGRPGNRGYNRGKQRSSSYSGGYNSELFGDYNSVESDYNYGSQSAEPSTPRQYGIPYSSPSLTSYSTGQPTSYGEASYSYSFSSPTQHSHFQLPSPMGGGQGWGGPISPPIPPAPSSAGLQQRSPPAVDSGTLITNLVRIPVCCIVNCVCLSYFVCLNAHTSIHVLYIMGC